MSAFARVAKGLGALVLLVGLLIGVPALLVAAAGWPLPTSLPRIDQLADQLTTDWVDPAVVVKGVALVVWPAWAVLTWSVLSEVARLARHWPRHVQGRQGAARCVAASLVAAVAALSPSFRAVSLAGAAIASPPVVAVVAGAVARPATPPPPMPGGDVLRVTEGDTLWSLARRHYGDARLWTRLWEANRGRHFADRVFNDPNLILVGWELHAPVSPPRGQPVAVPVVSQPATSPTTAPATTQTTATPSLSPLPSQLSTSTPPLVTQPSPPLGLGEPGSARAAETALDPPGLGAPSSWQLATGVAGAVLLATGVTNLVTARRRRRLERIEVGEVVTVPDPDLVPVERAARASRDLLAVARLDVALRSLAAATVPPGDPGVRPVLVRHEAGGDVEVVLARAGSGPAPSPWLDVDATTWRLPADVPLAALAASGAGVIAPCPALVLLGRVDGTDVYLDLEAAGCVRLDGPPAAARALARAVVAGLAISPLAERVHVVAAGLDCFGFANEDRVQAVADGAAAREVADRLSRPLREALAREEVPSTFALRARRPDELWEPVVVIATGTGDDTEVEELAAVAGAGGRGVAVLTSRPVPSSMWCLRLAEGGWCLDPVDAAIVPRGLLAAELADLGALLADAGAAPIAAPAETRSPVIVRTAAAAEPELVAEVDWQLQVRLLGPVDVVDAAGHPAAFERSKALELIAWLAQHRRQPTRSAARAALWQTEVRDATFANVVSDARRTLSRLVAPPQGEDWIGRTYAEHLPLHPLVTTDADLLAAGLARARRQDDEAAVETLRAGLDLVRGQPYAGTDYLWPDGEALPSHLTVMAITAAIEMATRCLTLEDVDGAFWATGRGMVVLPGHDELACLRMRAHALLGNLAGVRQEYEAYERVVTADPWGDSTPSPKVVELRRQLLRPAAHP